MSELQISPNSTIVDGYEGFRNGVAVSTLDSMKALSIKGDDAENLLDAAATGNIEELYENCVCYCLLLTDVGKIISDLIILKHDEGLTVLVEAKNLSEVKAQLDSLSGGFDDVAIQDVSADFAFISVDGPYAWELPKALIGLETIGLRLLTFQEFDTGGHEATLVRLGFAGEYGYLFIVPSEAAEAILAQMKEARPDAVFRSGPIPSEVRLEVRSYNCLVDTPNGESPLECGLHWMVNFRKDGFVGQEALQQELSNGLKRKLVALNVTADREVNASRVVIGGQDVGYVVNAAYSPLAETGMAMAYLDEPVAWVGVEVGLPTEDGPELPARVVSAPFLLAKSGQIEMS